MIGYNVRLDYLKQVDQMSKMKTHKGLMKRIKLTGKGKVKFKRSGTSHLNSHMSGGQIRKLRKTRCAKGGDVVRLQKMLGTRVVPGER